MDTSCIGSLRASPSALIFGATGQDGSYLSEHLLQLGYKVTGTQRRASSDNTGRLKAAKTFDKFTLCEADITDASSVYTVVGANFFDEIYVLAAQSHVHTSFEQPSFTMRVNTEGYLNVLEAVRQNSPRTRVYFAGSSEQFGKNYSQDADGEKYQDESTTFDPRSPYAVSKVASHDLSKLYRDAYGLHISVGILFNHESPRRGDNFVTKKIANYVRRLFLSYHGGEEVKEPLRLGNIDASRDWGHSRDYIAAMRLMLQQDIPDDYVICTGKTHTVEEFLNLSFGLIGEKWEDHVVIDKKFMRPAEVPYLRGRYDKANRVLGWKPQIDFKTLVIDMTFDGLNTSVMNSFLNTNYSMVI